MKAISQYIRVGTEYFKEVNYPLISGDVIKVIKKWARHVIVDDFGKEALKPIKKYEGFTTNPSHIDYKREIKGFYNLYEPISYSFSEAGEFPKTEMFLKYIFEEHYEIGLDYLTILWRNPLQILPILCLVSKDRKTGKTTFLNLLKLIFEGNMTINKNEDFRSRFNTDWTNKLLIAIDETLLDKKEDSERIKNLSTSNSLKSEGKGIDKVEIEFFGKLILCANDEENFIKVDKSEIRYWVRKIKPLSDSDEDPELLQKMKLEVPFFAHFLTTRELTTKKTTRMWFTRDQIHTKALDVLINGNRTSLEKEIDDFLVDEFHKLEVDELYYSTKELFTELNNRGVKISTGYISKILKDQYNLQSENSCYKSYRLETSLSDLQKQVVTLENRKGRYYTFKKQDFIKHC